MSFPSVLSLTLVCLKDGVHGIGLANWFQEEYVSAMASAILLETVMLLLKAKWGLNH